MEITKALFITRGLTPYLADEPSTAKAHKLAHAIQSMGAEVRAFMPKFGSVNERRNQLHEVIRLSGLNIIIDDADHPLIIKVATLQPSRMQVYFIDNDDYFGPAAFDTAAIEYDSEEDDERLIFFVRGIIETVKKLRWIPQLIHCNGWLSALTPIYIRRLYADDASLQSSKIVFDITGDTFRDTLAPRFVEKLVADGLAPDVIDRETLFDANALTRLAIDYSDAIIQTGEADPAVVEYARNSGKPFLPYDPKATAETFSAFYSSL